MCNASRNLYAFNKGFVLDFVISLLKHDIIIIMIITRQDIIKKIIQIIVEILSAKLLAGRTVATSAFLAAFSLIFYVGFLSKC